MAKGEAHEYYCRLAFAKGKIRREKEEAKKKAEENERMNKNASR